MRATTFNGLLGLPWRANASGPDAYDCWHLARHIQRELFARDLPDITVPADPSWRWMIGTIEIHPERKRWQESPQLNGLIKAADGSLVLMARSDRPAHIGVWLAPENRIIHCDQGIGVVLETPSMLRVGGWLRLRFFEPLFVTSSFPDKSLP